MDETEMAAFDLLEGLLKPLFILLILISKEIGDPVSQGGEGTRLPGMVMIEIDKIPEACFDTE